MPNRLLIRTLGARVHLAGDVTTLQAIGARSAQTLEKSLGFGHGRLAQGWSVLVLKQQLQPADFEFGGLTLRSGGRLGLPAQNPLSDVARPRVHDAILHERGRKGYTDLQKLTLRNIPEKGSQRLAKVIPTIRHSDKLPPHKQYPMGAARCNGS